MRCVECGRLRVDSAERGWVTVLSPAGERRVHYCCDCIEDLVQRASTADEADDHAHDA